MAAEQIRWLLSVKGKAKASLDGFYYHYESSSKKDPALKFYVSERYRKAKCTGRIHVRGDEVWRVQANTCMLQTAADISYWR